MLWNMVKEYGCRDSCKSNYHTITTTKAPTFGWIIFYGVITYCPLWPKKFSLVDFIVVAGGLDYIFILFLKVVWYCAIFCLSICFISNNIWSIYDTTLCDSLSVTCIRSVVFSGYSGFLHQKKWLPWYNWNIVKSGIKHHNPNLL
jgi:hypothetical protein